MCGRDGLKLASTEASGARLNAWPLGLCLARGQIAKAVEHAV
jgi:hypothetical protein